MYPRWSSPAEAPEVTTGVTEVMGVTEVKVEGRMTGRGAPHSPTTHLGPGNSELYTQGCHDITSVRILGDFGHTFHFHLE